MTSADHMTVISIDALKNKIVQPGFEKQLMPLLLFRGGVGLGRIHRMWNFLITMRETGCTSFADGTQRLTHNPEFSHLCGPEKKVQYSSLFGFTSRIIQTNKIKILDPHLYDYARFLNPYPFTYATVSEISNRSRCASWRTFNGKRRQWKPFDAEREQGGRTLVYPFLIHDGGKPEHELLKRVNAAVPRSLPPDLRADICQDIIVGILCGDFPEDNLSLPAKEMTRRVLKMFPTKYGDLSLDAPIPGCDDLRLIDTI